MVQFCDENVPFCRLILQFEQLLDDHMEGMVVRIGLAEGGEQACRAGEQARRGPASWFRGGWRGAAPRSLYQVAA